MPRTTTLPKDEVRYTGVGKVTAILDRLYAGASVWLDRKRALYDRLRAGST